MPIGKILFNLFLLPIFFLSQANALGLDSLNSCEPSKLDLSAPINKPVLFQFRPNIETGFKYCGFINITELGVGIGVGTIEVQSYAEKNNFNGVSFRTVNGYQFNYIISLGLGIGYEYYGGNKMIPVTIDARFASGEGKWACVFNANAGYAFNTGFVAHPAIGFRKYVSEKIALVGNLGYKLQQAQIQYTTYYRTQYSTIPNVYNESRMLRFTTLSIGLSF
jgi:hypothetical protein